jgi:hypothetical protein
LVRKHADEDPVSHPRVTNVAFYGRDFHGLLDEAGSLLAKNVPLFYEKSLDPAKPL